MKKFECLIHITKVNYDEYNESTQEYAQETISQNISKNTMDELLTDISKKLIEVGLNNRENIIIEQIKEIDLISEIPFDDSLLKDCPVWIKYHELEKIRKEKEQEKIRVRKQKEKQSLEEKEKLQLEKLIKKYNIKVV